MPILLEALKQLGLGGQLLVAATLLVAGVYAWKAAKGVNLVAAYAASGMIYVVVVVAVLALAIAAGWVDPNPGAFVSFASDALAALLEAVGERVAGVLP